MCGDLGQLCSPAGLAGVLQVRLPEGWLGQLQDSAECTLSLGHETLHYCVGVTARQSLALGERKRFTQELPARAMGSLLRQSVWGRPGAQGAGEMYRFLHGGED